MPRSGPCSTGRVGWMTFFAVKSDELHSPYFCGWRLPALKICELQNTRIFGFWPIAIDSICFFFRDSMSMDDHSPYEFPCPWYPVISLDVFHCKRPAQVATLTLLLVLWWLFSSLYYHHYNMTTLYYNVYLYIYCLISQFWMRYHKMSRGIMGYTVKFMHIHQIQEHVDTPKLADNPRIIPMMFNICHLHVDFTKWPMHLLWASTTS